MSTTPCPRCGAAASGNFCASCGASLGGRHCTTCGVSADPGARFCNGCGAALGAGSPAAAGAGAAVGAPRSAAGGSGAGGPRKGGAQGSGESDGASQIGWWAAGAMMVFLIAVLAYPILVPQEGMDVNPGPTGAPASAFGDPSSVDLNSMSPQQAAANLYGRVMTLLSAGDTTQVQFFLPMAISAHQQAEPLDADGRFHYSSLQRIAGQPEDALVSADQILEEIPTHLLGLYAAGMAAQDLGETERAAGYFQRLLDGWDDERALNRLEYEQHRDMMLDVRETAEAAVGG